MSGPVILLLQADGMSWYPFRPGDENTAASQTAEAWQGDELVATVTITWPKGAVACPVVCHVDGRHAGPRD